MAANIGKIHDQRIINLYGLIKLELENKLPSGYIMEFNLDVLTNKWNDISFRKNWVEGLRISFEGTPKLINGFGHGILLTSDKYDNKKIKSKLANNIKFSSRTNNWMKYNAGSYSQLSRRIDSFTNLQSLAGEISDYMIQVIVKETDSCEKINQHLLGLDTVVEM